MISKVNLNRFNMIGSISFGKTRSEAYVYAKVQSDDAVITVVDGDEGIRIYVAEHGFVTPFSRVFHDHHRIVLLAVLEAWFEEHRACQDYLPIETRISMREKKSLVGDTLDLFEQRSFAELDW